MGPMSAARRTITTAVGLALAVLTLSPPSATLAAEAIEWLPGRTLAALGFDLDADGDRELVRLVDEGEDDGVVLDVWDVVGERWARIGSPVAARPGSGPPAAGTRVIGRLVTWQREGRERVLVVSAHSPPTGPQGENCCLTIGELRLGRDGPVLEPIPVAGFESAHVIQPVDLDADGTDELLVQTYAFSGDRYGVRVQLVRWVRSRLASVHSLAGEYQLVEGAIGDSDGVAGDDVLVGPGASGEVRRLTWRNGRVVSEQWTDADSVYPFGIVEGDLVAIAPDGLRRIHWPRDGAPIEVASSPILSSGSVFVATSGNEVAIVVPALSTGAAAARSAVLNPDLEPLGEFVIPHTEPLWTLASNYSTPDGNLYPFLGPFPIRPDETEVWQAGAVITAGGLNGYTVREASPFVGIVPMAAVGPDDGWIAAGSITQFQPPGPSVYLFDVGGGAGDGGLRLLPRDVLEGFSPTPGSVEVRMERALEVEREAGRRELVTGRNGFAATVTAPVGTSVVVINDGSADVTEVEGGSVDVHFRPRASSLERDERFSRSVAIVLPDGRFMVESWTGRFLAGDPELSATAETVPFAWGATIEGRTMAGSAIGVAGAATTADEDGRFALDVDASLWPQDVLVSVEDPLGRMVDMELEVVGFVDYRGWPWLFVVVLITAATGVHFYLRTPMIRTLPAPDAGGDGTLEEIDA